MPMRPSRKYLLRDCSRNRKGYGRERGNLISFFFVFFFLNSFFELLDEDRSI